MNEALLKTVESGISLEDAVYMASTAPANILGLKNKGRIEQGANADLVLIDSEFNVRWTMIEGHIYD
ncbi:amidohydrolase family protein [Bacillus niameyensis]|uniref:amidohydrolase family protein n=1 Tax=Bacillus niameyensis TaxID=1522308 RepID=UPI000A00355C|nr:amidohydrolase family protein [Bacillus niameyensis]